MTQSECEELTLSLASTPAAVRRLAEGLSMNETHWKPTDCEFSVLENVCHLRDIEVDGYAVRIQRILLEDRPFLVDINGAQLAEERDYNNQELSSAMEAFAKAREYNLTLIRGLSDDQLERTGMLENAGAISLGRLLELMREHDEAHLRELSDLTAVSRAVNDGSSFD